MTAIEARRQALLKFGSVDAIKEISRSERTPVYGNAPARHAPCPAPAAKDSRVYGRRSPDARAGNRREHIFGVIDSILIRPLAYPNAEALVGIWHTSSGRPGSDGIELFAIDVNSPIANRIGPFNNSVCGTPGAQT